MNAAAYAQRALLLTALCAIACGDDDGVSDAGLDASVEMGGVDMAAPDIALDMAPTDAAAEQGMDAAVEQGTDAAAEMGMDAMAEAGPDGSLPLEGFGTIMGECGRLGGELASANPSFYSVRLDFADDGYDEPGERPLLTPDAAALLEAGTAGGSSAISEAFALEVLVRCEGAELSATETEIVYDPVESDKTDFRALFGETPIGVSVVRAFSFPLGSDYPVSEADRILRDKLAGILESSANVTEAFAWDKQILAVLAPDDMPLESVETAWSTLSDDLRADTILFVIVTDGEDESVYLNRR